MSKLICGFSLHLLLLLAVLFQRTESALTLTKNESVMSNTSLPVTVTSESSNNTFTFNLKNTNRSTTIISSGDNHLVQEEISQGDVSSVLLNTSKEVNSSSQLSSSHYQNQEQNESSNDNTIMTQDKQVQTEQNNGVEDRSEKDREAQMALVSGLIEHDSELQQKLLSNRLERDVVMEELQGSIGRKKVLETERQRIAEVRHQIDNKLKKIRLQIPRYDETIEVLRKQASDGIKRIRLLREKSYLLMREKRQLDSALRERGLEQWVQRSVKDSVSPFVSDALVQGTASVVEPVLDGIEKLATVNQDLTKKMSVTLQEHVPIVEKPFYSGVVTYVVLLLPTVLLTSVVLRIKRGFAKLTKNHLVILGNAYFLMLSAGCFIATFLGSVDVLVTFRHNNLRLFDFVMFLHGLLYLFHVLLHLSFSLQVRSTDSTLYFGLLVGIGAHFFIHSYSHAMRNEDSDVDRLAYLIYTGILGFIIYDLTVKPIQRLQRKRVMTLNNASISISEAVCNEQNVVTCTRGNTREGSRRFPLTGKGYTKKQLHSTVLPLSVSQPTAPQVKSTIGNSNSQPLSSKRAVSFAAAKSGLTEMDHGICAKDV